MSAAGRSQEDLEAELKDGTLSLRTIKSTEAESYETNQKTKVQTRKKEPEPLST